MNTLPADFDAARRILELAEKMLSETGKPADKLPETFEGKLAANIAKAFEDKEHKDNEILNR